MKVGEIWKDIENYPNYQVSNLGNVKSVPRQRTKGGILRQTISNCALGRCKSSYGYVWRLNYE